ncbi:MAG: hypothetical protein H6878_12535 [Rhodobiaceae bacterium]|nr:hypothetical protein [Rhodobiaceae bacterium]MCC0017087.1 hypothetical protein [Rhodobiaceae bacterium]
MQPGPHILPFLTARRLLGALAAVLLVAVSGILASRFYSGSDGSPGATGSLASQPLPLLPRGPSGLPLPRYVSLKSSRVNVRIGPSQDHDVAWVFNTAGLPVEIVAEFENWRRIRDSEGAEGWVYHSLLSGKRMALVAPWKAGAGRESQPQLLHHRASEASSATAMLEAGALVRVDKCNAEWCEITAGGRDGFVRQELLWGVYPGEVVD